MWAKNVYINWSNVDIDNINDIVVYIVIVVVDIVDIFWHKDGEPGQHVIVIVYCWYDWYYFRLTGCCWYCYCYWYCFREAGWRTGWPTCWQAGWVVLRRSWSVPTYVIKIWDKLILSKYLINLCYQNIRSKYKIKISYLDTFPLLFWTPPLIKIPYL